MKTPICYYGGKQLMLPHIISLIPKHEVYVEPFAGGAAVFFAKKLAKVNIINDLNGELINFYRTCVSDFDALQTEIYKTLHSRKQHEVARAIYKHPDYFSRVQRAWAVWVLSTLSFSGQLGAGLSTSKSNAPKYDKLAMAKPDFTEKIKQQLEHCTIEQDDAFAIIKRFDCANAFHFLDPPYVGSNMGHYAGMFDKDDLINLLELCAILQGKFMLTMYPNETIEQFVIANDWTIHRVERTVTAANTKRRKQEEWMVCNYKNTQVDITLF